MVEPWTLNDNDSMSHIISILFIVVAFLLFTLGGWMMIYIRKTWYESIENGLYFAEADDVEWNYKQAG
jgi:uncharacterized membrane protein